MRPAVAAQGGLGGFHAAQTALTATLQAATFDLALVEELKAVIVAAETASVELQVAFEAADLAAAPQYATFDAALLAAETAAAAVGQAEIDLAAAVAVQTQADLRLTAAEAALVVAEADGDNDLIAIAEAEVTAATEAQAAAVLAVTAQQTAFDNAVTAEGDALIALDAAQAALDTAIFTNAAFVAAEANFFAAADRAQAAVVALGAAPGTDPALVQTLVDTVLEVCATPAKTAVVPAGSARPTVAAQPTVSPTDRGLNIQTAATDDGTATGGNVLLLGGLAGAGLALSAAGVMALRRRNQD